MPDFPGVASAPTSPARENIGRGTLFALLTIPAGVAVWLVMWGLGYIAAIVGAVVAFVAMRVYAAGAGRLSRVGAVVVLAVTLVTLVLAFLSGIVYDAVVSFGDAAGLGAWATLTHPEFWPLFAEVLPEAFPDYQKDLLWALGFGALGSLPVLRAAFAGEPPAESSADGAYEQGGSSEPGDAHGQGGAHEQGTEPQVDPARAPGQG